jgi:hypothetical protein
MDLDKCCGEGRGPEAALHLPAVPTLLLAAAVLVMVSVWHYYWPAVSNANSIRQEPPTGKKSKVPYPHDTKSLSHARKLPILARIYILQNYLFVRSLFLCIHVFLFIFINTHWCVVFSGFGKHRQHLKNWMRGREFVSRHDITHIARAEN